MEIHTQILGLLLDVAYVVKPVCFVMLVQVNFMYDAPAGMDLKKPDTGEGLKLELDESRQVWFLLWVPRNDVHVGVGVDWWAFSFSSSSSLWRHRSVVLR